MRLLFILSFVLLFHTFDFRNINKATESTTRRPLPPTPNNGSPLDYDGGSTNGDTASDSVIQLPPAVIEVQSLPTDCTKDCYRKLQLSLRTALDASADYIKRYESICSQYDESLLCFKGREHCTTNTYYNAYTSGLKFMCFEQRLAFEDNLPCVRKIIDDASKECQGRCNLNQLATGLAVKEVLQKDMKILHLLDTQMARIGMQESCRLTNCFLGCYKARLDSSCGGVAGSLLAEAVLRPFSYPEMNGGEYLNEVFQSFIPQQCNFMGDKKALEALRMDPKLIEQLNDKYHTTTTPASPTAIDPALAEVWKNMGKSSLAMERSESF
uniref:Chondroitin proteoglycan 4 domain-containing protein n=1 Tax=Panagrolaimus superbus TaxID=310955 RepID=A0A914XZE9_9BILA